ncbi:hypothetical protein F5880DRAFT_110886 [Lentinula raphanica]|nr:hypothetical protein F5880DRAFT_110886 [Lentinula raphanica]
MVPLSIRPLYQFQSRKIVMKEWALSISMNQAYSRSSRFALFKIQNHSIPLRSWWHHLQRRPRPRKLRFYVQMHYLKTQLNLNSKLSSNSGHPTPMMAMMTSPQKPAVTVTLIGSQSSTTTDHAYDSSPSNTSPAGDTTKRSAVIIGAVVGAVGIAFLLGVVLLYRRYRTRRRTTNIISTGRVRSFSSDTVVDQWSIDKEKQISDDCDYYEASFRRSPKSMLTPQDSVSNVFVQKRFSPSVLPPIPAARYYDSSPDASSVISNTTASSAPRTKDRKVPSISLSALSSSAGSAASGSLFPIPVLPPRTRTDRQKLLEEEIQKLQAKILHLQGNGDISSSKMISEGQEQELRQIHRRVELLKKIHESDWALGVGRF